MARAISTARQLEGLTELLAFAHRDNKASRWVLAKTGFAETGYVTELNRLRFSLIL